MEATEEQRRGLLHQILPPRLEDAGLEECALPPDSIKEAFLKAATAVKSRAATILTSDDEGDGDCVGDPWPDAQDRSDAVVGGSPEADESLGPCAAVKGVGETVVIGGYDVVVAGGGGEEAEDEVVVGSEGKKGGKDCVDGLKGLEIGDDEEEEEKKKKKKNGGDDEKENGDEDEERPVLVGGYV